VAWERRPQVAARWNPSPWWLSLAAPLWLVVFSSKENPVRHSAQYSDSEVRAQYQDILYMDVSYGITLTFNTSRTVNFPIYAKAESNSSQFLFTFSGARGPNMQSLSRRDVVKRDWLCQGVWSILPATPLRLDGTTRLVVASQQRKFSRRPSPNT
jgi:hypothetical protein